MNPSSADDRAFVHRGRRARGSVSSQWSAIGRPVTAPYCKARRISAGEATGHTVVAEAGRSRVGELAHLGQLGTVLSPS